MLNRKRSFLRYLVLYLAKLGIMPKTNFYKGIEFENLIKDGDFDLIKSERLSKLPEYFMVARQSE